MMRLKVFEKDTDSKPFISTYFMHMHINTIYRNWTHTIHAWAHVQTQIVCICMHFSIHAYIYFSYLYVHVTRWPEIPELKKYYVLYNFNWCLLVMRRENRGNEMILWRYIMCSMKKKVTQSHVYTYNIHKIHTYSTFLTILTTTNSIYIRW